ncbi:MAG: hypothetical protein KU29_09735 [Sulfurovum sp. FS06-10]|nr:MAG: hypothetical protein KU29_09735 [Sulfurovum sp. FS06-10]
MTYKEHYKNIACLAVILSLFSGCATTQKELFVLPQEPQKNITVYVDNSLDLERQKNAVETYVWTINNTDSFRVEINKEPKVTPLDIKLTRTTSYLTCESNIKDSYLLPNIKFVTYNYEYYDKLLAPERDINYYEKKYTAIKLDDSSFEIKGFSSKKEAMDVFVELMRSTYDANYFANSQSKAPMPKEKEYSIDYWRLNMFYPGRGVVFDPYALENENRLVVKPIIEAYSLKKHLINVLQAGGYSVVDKREDAQMLISVQNLYFGTTKDLQNSLPIINSRLNKESKQQESSKNLAKETESLTNQASLASDLGNNNLAKGMVGVAAANLVLNLFSSDGRYDGYFISSMRVEYKGKEILDIPNFMKLENSGEVLHQVLCVPESRAFKSSRMFLKSLENKLGELK